MSRAAVSHLCAFDRRRGVVRVALAASLVMGAGSAAAWSNHALCTWPALAVLPEVARAAPVDVERLEDFLAAEAGAVATLLEAEEQWARARVPTYPPRPATLAFRADAGASREELRRRFIAAVRINPASRLTLFLQVPPGRAAKGRAAIAESDVTTLTRSETTRANTFVALRPAEAVPAIDVVATASDEPDHGLDIGLWEDSGTAYGRAYGFGKQPFGVNPAIEFASQGPFHVGFFHEASVVYKAAPFLLRSYAEFRIHLWRSLAVHALKSGHPYWGWRFAGWALHHVQDLTQPYHARVLPGVGVARMLWINTLDLAGLHTQKEHAIAFVTNRHLAIENYQLQRIRRAWLRRDENDPALRALGDLARDAGDAAVTAATPRAGVARQSHAEADALDAALERSLPRKYTSEPAYVFGETEAGVDLLAVVEGAGPAAQSAMNRALVRLLGHFGTQSRGFVRGLLDSAR